jgi:hypothetical protein
MKNYIFLTLATCALAIGLTSCSDDEESAPITGTWEGTQSLGEASIPGVPIPIYSEEDDDFNTVLEFNDDGSVTVTDEEDDYTAEGTWEFTDGNKKIIVSGAFPENEIFEPTETFTIKELNNSKLTLHLEKTMMLETDDGDFEGTVEVTFKFDRVN